MGFLHSFTTGSDRGWSRRPRRRVDGRMHVALLYCHNPDTWTMSNGIPVTIETAIEELASIAMGSRSWPAGSP